MDAVKFIEERDRMFEVAGYAPSLIYRHEKSAEEIVREVEEWSAAHPVKTRQDVFLEHYPEAEMGKDGVMLICPVAVSAAYRNKTGTCASPARPQCSVCRREFWTKVAG